MDIHKLVNWFHVLIVGGLFLYVGINREKIYGGLFSILFYLGLIIILYHLFKIYGYLKGGKGIWVNLIHVFIVGPLLVYIGYNGIKTSRKFFELLLMLGFASIGYHLYYLLK
jgi:hypothetical protein